jgi:hypothetical protein
MCCDYFLQRGSMLKGKRSRIPTCSLCENLIKEFPNGELASKFGRERPKSSLQKDIIGPSVRKEVVKYVGVTSHTPRISFSCEGFSLFISHN